MSLDTRSATVETDWGTLGLVERGGVVLGIEFADGPGGLSAGFDRADVGSGEHGPAADLAEEVARRIEVGEGFEGIPVDASGTPFQEAVWEELTEIPRGEVLTYSEVALRIGRPNAVRAVGSACGANPVALLIPCHRVVASDGSLGGYRWGVERKVKILTAEGVELATSALRQAG
ncbi:MAG: methylated-DNA--[protein]-cysteine S-methyltransferase [Solirubrobacterales bacterium]